MARSVMVPNGSSVVRYVHVAPRSRQSAASRLAAAQPGGDLLVDRALQLLEHRVHRRRKSPIGFPPPSEIHTVPARSSATAAR